jgi:predicted transcriptional regulator
MITRQALLDIMMQQQETINLLRDTARHNYRVDTKAIKWTEALKDYWKKRAEKAEDELIDLKLFGKTQPHENL